MREYRLHQFERNRYFPGKTLTVRDFKAEQDYFNQKRYMINRLVHGSGVLWGLQVDRVDSETITINPGIALDCFGREIVVNKPVTMGIRDMEGAPVGGISSDTRAALCIEYYDDVHEPVETEGVLTSCCTELHEHNRIKEKYKVKIKEDLNNEGPSLAHLLTQTVELYNNEGIKITRTTPTWISPNELFIVRITIERKTLNKDYTISISESLGKNLYLNDDKSNPVVFSIHSNDKGPILIKDYYARAAANPVQNDSYSVIQSVVTVASDGTSESCRASAMSQLKIMETSISNEIVRSFFKEKSVIDTSNESIMLASLELAVNKQSPLGFTINAITSPGSDSYIYSNDMLYHLLRNLDMRLIAQKYPLEIKTTSASVKHVDPGPGPSADVIYRQIEKHLEFDFTFPKEMATGVVFFEIESEILAAGDNGITEIINPNIGKGPIYVNVDWEQCRYRESVVPKDSVVFGVYPNHKTGTFRIWYKVIKDIERIEKGVVKTIHTLHFRWWAFTNVHDRGEIRARRFAITPKRVRIKEEKDKDISYPLTVRFDGTPVPVKDVIWEVVPDKSTGTRASFAVKNNSIIIPKGTLPQSFILKGTYKNLYDKIIISIEKR